MPTSKEKIDHGNRTRAEILKHFTRPLTSRDVMVLCGLTRSNSHRYLIQLEQERYLNARPEKFLRDGHWSTIYEAVGTLEYLPRDVDRTFDYEGLSSTLIRFMGLGEGKPKVGEVRDLKSYHEKLATDGLTWSSDNQKCLGGFSYGVSAGLL